MFAFERKFFLTVEDGRDAGGGTVTAAAAPKPATAPAQPEFKPEPQPVQNPYKRTGEDMVGTARQTGADSNAMEVVEAEHGKTAGTIGVNNGTPAEIQTPPPPAAPRQTSTPEDVNGSTNEGLLIAGGIAAVVLAFVVVYLLTPKVEVRRK